MMDVICSCENGSLIAAMERLFAADAQNKDAYKLPVDLDEHSRDSSVLNALGV